MIITSTQFTRQLLPVTGAGGCLAIWVNVGFTGHQGITIDG
ncbi:MAG: hypothetical protein IGNPGNKH_00023 [Sodalis sp. Ffu]|nr:MAG: hypothetical protein IGNPGNKH_00023 [Sodalis sp. Ffu]